MSVFGVDLGAKNSCAAITRQGGVDVVANEVSKRETASYVCLGDEERYIGEPGLDKAVRNSANTVCCIKRFIGLMHDDPRVAEEKKFVFANTCADENGRLMFDLQFDGEQRQFYPEQILAMYLTKIRSYVIKETGMEKTKDVVLSVPTWYNADQRKLTIQAAEMAGLNCMSLIHETTAACVDYGIFRNSTFPAEEANGIVVAFVDVGYSEAKVTIAKFWKSNARILAHEWDLDLGSRAIDYELTQFYGAEIQKKYKIDPLSNKRCTLRLMQACEKLKTMLSANAVASLNIECLMDVDVNFNQIERASVEPVLNSLAERLGALCQRAMDKAGIEQGKFHSVECLGGGVRVPILKTAIAKAFGAEQCSFTLNASESVARGCAITAAVFSPLFQVREFVVNEKPLLPICIGYQSEAASAQSSVSFLPTINKVKTALRENDSYPKSLEYSFDRTDAFDLHVFYDENSPDVSSRAVMGVGSKLHIGRFHIGAHNKPTNGEVKVVVKFHANGLVWVESATTKEKYEVEEIVKKPKPAEAAPAAEGEKKDDPDAPPKDGEGAEKTEEGDKKEAEKKKEPEMVEEKVIKQKTRTVSLSVTPDLTILGHPAAVLQRCIKAEADMVIRDKKIQQTKEARNDLESYIYDNRSRVAEGGMLFDFLTAADRETFTTLSAQMEEWLYTDEGYEGKYEDYAKRLKQLREIGQPAHARYTLRSDMPFHHQQWMPKIAALSQKAADKIGKGAHITDEELNGAIAKCTEALQWADKLVQDLLAMPKTENATCAVGDFDAKLKEVTAAVNAVLNKKAPAPPPKDDAKKDSKKKDGDAAPAADATPASPKAEGDADAPPADSQGPPPPSDLD